MATLAQRLSAVLQAIGVDMKSVLPWAAKTPPSGAVVGTSDSQTLGNKTLAAPVISGSARFEAVQQLIANTSSTPVNFANGQKVHVYVQVNTTLQITTPGVGNYQIVVTMASAGLSVSVNPVSFWVGAASQPAMNTDDGGRTLLSFYSDGSFLYCGVAKLNAT